MKRFITINIEDYVRYLDLEKKIKDEKIKYRLLELKFRELSSNAIKWRIERAALYEILKEYKSKSFFQRLFFYK